VRGTAAAAAAIGLGRVMSEMSSVSRRGRDNPAPKADSRWPIGTDKHAGSRISGFGLLGLYEGFGRVNTRMFCHC